MMIVRRFPFHFIIFIFFVVVIFFIIITVFLHKQMQLYLETRTTRTTGMLQNQLFELYIFPAQHGCFVLVVVSMLVAMP